MCGCNRVFEDIWRRIEKSSSGGGGVCEEIGLVVHVVNSDHIVVQFCRQKVETAVRQSGVCAKAAPGAPRGGRCSGARRRRRCRLSGRLAAARYCMVIWWRRASAQSSSSTCWIWGAVQLSPAGTLARFRIAKCCYTLCGQLGSLPIKRLHNLGQACITCRLEAPDCLHSISIKGIVLIYILQVLPLAEW